MEDTLQGLLWSRLKSGQGFRKQARKQQESVHPSKAFSCKYRLEVLFRVELP